MKCTKYTCPCKQSHPVTPWQMTQATQGEVVPVLCGRCGNQFARLYEDTLCPLCLTTLYPKTEKNENQS